ncbi:DUF975 family protein [Clostridium sp. LIBA-8841]|uniref:DUF975 family protein n=1 Tax=Clostridium sp. LIBA-8841 TaxID=2987530 RepID=UPI002AC5D653|nr:DUF975 family protein [Clostridium sp. LIBA-8841]MDZ5254590.1 DUF975 family protein [Clostridium sp. LIBA-8841]
MTDRVECKLKAKELLRGRWGNAAGACLVVTISSMLVSFFLSPIPIFGWIIVAVVSSFLNGAFIKYCIKLTETDEKVKYLDCFVSFKAAIKIFLCNILIGVVLGIGLLVLTMIFTTASFISESVFLMFIFFVILLTLGLFIEACIFTIPIILTEDDEIGVIEAINMSWEVTKDYKLKYVIMILSFVGWGILALLTLGIGAFWLQPYIMLTVYIFYKGIRNANIAIE